MSPPVETVLTLIAPAGGLDETIVASVAKALKVMGVEAGEADWLSPGEACDIPFSGANPQAAETAVREALSGAAVDLLAQPAAGRRKSLLVANMDCTIITTEANGKLAPLHARMPVILDPADFERWLSPDLAANEALDLLRPAPDSAVDFHAVSTHVNNARNDDPSCIEPLEDGADDDV